MIKILLAAFLTVFVVNLRAQTNLVSNPSFEDTTTCPTNGFMINAEGWEPYSSSPDYYNNCVETNYGYSVPNNFAGIQSAASGQAYAGAICFIEGETDYSLNREIIGGNLISSLIIGQTYFVSFKVVSVPYTTNVASSMAINKLGALFSTVPYTNTDASTIPPIQNFAHIYTNSIITDSTNWTTIFGSFVADSNYSYICIGNFFENDATDTVHITSSAFPSAYYLFDDICVSTDSLYSANYSYSGIDGELPTEKIDFYPNPASDFITINIDNNIEHSVIIVNSIGEVVSSGIISEQSKVNLEHLSSGVYFIIITNKNKSTSTKLFIN